MPLQEESHLKMIHESSMTIFSTSSKNTMKVTSADYNMMRYFFACEFDQRSESLLLLLRQWFGTIKTQHVRKFLSVTFVEPE